MEKCGVLLLVSLVFFISFLCKVSAEDTTPPNITINSPKENSTIYSKSVLLNFTTDENANCTHVYIRTICFGDGICITLYSFVDFSQTGGTEHTTNRFLDCGNNTISFSCKDSSGNQDGATINVEAIRDDDNDGSSCYVDCDDNNASIYTGAPEICDCIDNQCPGDVGYGEIDEGLMCDSDEDGSLSDVDCDDCNSNIYPEAPELCDLLDNQCSGDMGYGEIDEGFNNSDNDSDGYMVCEGDCDDNNASIHPASDGMVIRNDTILCQGTYNLPNGLKIKEDNITLDCNGSTLRGSDTGSGLGHSGIAISKDKTTVKNCRIENYFSGISLSSDNNTIIRVQINNSPGWGIDAYNSNNNLIKDSVFSNSEWGGISMGGHRSNKNNVLLNNILENNKEGISLKNADNIRIINNTATKSRFSLENADNITIINNTAINGGLNFRNVHNSTIKDNWFEGFGYAVYFSANCSNNLFYHNNIIHQYPFYFSIYSGVEIVNTWDYKGEGNYWSRYDENTEGCYDLDNNGICDSPFVLNEDNQDNYPFTKINGWLDEDGDGIMDVVDNCAGIGNPSQEDKDNDGVGDVCDICPSDPDNDIDNDGICGDIDNCPDDANPNQEDRDQDGIGDICDECPDDAENDIDQDSVCGDVDNCPADYNPNQEDSDQDSIGNPCDICPNDPDNDIDNDRICGDVDNCPYYPNPNQEDSDNDDVGNICDKCPDSKSGEEVDQYGCDPFQFCEPFYCGLGCFYADWKNNEEENPNDCAMAIVLREGTYEPKCVPLTCAD